MYLKLASTDKKNDDTKSFLRIKKENQKFMKAFRILAGVLGQPGQLLTHP
jgi:hypothetical protein